MECSPINQLQSFAISDSGAVSNPHVSALKHALLFAFFAHSLRFQTHPLLCGLCIGLWYGFGTLNVNGRFALETAHVTSNDMLTRAKIISFGWSSLGTSLGT